jgi:hypothetical protein
MQYRNEAFLLLLLQRGAAATIAAALQGAGAQQGVASRQQGNPCLPFEVCLSPNLTYAV